jgi:hypothetical protein
MPTFGRKVVQQGYSEKDFRRLVSDFERLRTVRPANPSDEARRIKQVADAIGPELDALPEIYGRRMAEAKQSLDRHLAPLNNYLESVSMSWRVVHFLVIGPSVWDNTPLGKVLIYGLGLTPFDPWNQILTVNHPIGMADLGMAYFEPRAEEQFSADFQARYQGLVDDWSLAESIYEKKRDLGVLIEMADLCRLFIDNDTKSARRLLAWNLYGRAKAEPTFY